MVRMCAIVLAIWLLALTPAAAWENNELEDGRWFTLYDTDHRVLLRTGIRINVGDRFLDSDNRMYEVYKVDSRRLRAWARLVSAEDGIALVAAEGLAGADHNRVAVYHTHSGESYIPSDGVASTDQRRGGIYLVGEQFSQRLEGHTVDVTHSQATHFPYAGSYRRSRTTAMELLEQGLDAIFDIHRDAAPWGEYFQEIEDMILTQVLLVVGTQNPAYRANEEFAWQLKATADEIYPDLVKGVFYARGDYNQDLHPRSLLLEIGAHTNSRTHAKVGARAFADVVAITLYGKPQPAPDDTPGLDDEEVEQDPTLQPTVDRPGGRQGGLLRGIITLMALVGLGGSAFLFISTGSWQGAKEKLHQFFGTEFRDLLAPVRWDQWLNQVRQQFTDLWQRLRRRTRV